MSYYEKIAIILSSLSILFSLLALIWNIYRDIILKPKLKVRFYVGCLQQGENKKEVLTINATNYGPKSITCACISVKDFDFLSWIFRIVFYGQIIPDYNNPYSTPLPKVLNVGETCQFYLPFNENCFLGGMCNYIGVTDTFGRNHWAPKKDVAIAKTKYYDRFYHTNI